MPKRKTKKPEDINELIGELDSANETNKGKLEGILADKTPHKSEPKVVIVDDIDEDVKPQDNEDSNKDDKKRDKLLKLAEEGYLDKSAAFIKKASQNVINKLYTEYERKRTQKANEFLTNLIISTNLAAHWVG